MIQVAKPTRMSPRMEETRSRWFISNCAEADCADSLRIARAGRGGSARRGGRQVLDGQLFDRKPVHRESPPYISILGGSMSPARNAWSLTYMDAQLVETLNDGDVKADIYSLSMPGEFCVVYRDAHGRVLEERPLTGISTYKQREP